MSNKITMPWEERPAGCKDVMWRYSENPVIDRYHIPSSNSIFNSAVVPFKDGYAGVFRCDNRAVPTGHGAVLIKAHMPSV